MSKTHSELYSSLFLFPLHEKTALCPYKVSIYNEKMHCNLLFRTQRYINIDLAVIFLTMNCYLYDFYMTVESLTLFLPNYVPQPIFLPG